MRAATVKISNGQNTVTLDPQSESLPTLNSFGSHRMLFAKLGGTMASPSIPGKFAR